MSRPRLYHTEAIVLRASPAGEADRLLTLLTPFLGKLKVVARGVRKSTSKLGGHLDTLTRSSLTIARGHSLDVVTGADAQESFLALKSNLDLLSRAIYLTELVDSLNPLDAPTPAGYDLYLEGLRALEAGASPHLALRYLEMHLLGQAGFSLELHHCVECRGRIMPGDHFFSCAAGGILCASCRPSHVDACPISVQALKVLRFFSASPLTSAILVSMKTPLRRELAALMDSYVRFTLEREVRSASFLRSLSQPAPQDAQAAVK